MSNRLVLIGASLGGLDALTEILSALPADFPAPIVIVQHRSLLAREGFARLLDGRTPLTVTDADDRAPLEPGLVHIAPAGYHVLIENDHCALTVDAPVIYARPSIDVLFESGADDAGKRCIGVLLTAASADGAEGLRAIARAGGSTIVQDPATAASPVAILAAMRLTAPDHVLDLEDIAPLLCRLAARKTR